MSNDEPLAQTPLHPLHLELGARMTPFAGYEMPVQYQTGIIKEHNHTREAAGLFDVSHMGQIRLIGKTAAAELEKLAPADIVGLALNHQRYALFTNNTGGILDDLMVTNTGDALFLVVNAACKQDDIDLLRVNIGNHCLVEALPDRALLALQGPLAATVLARLAPAVGKLTFMTAARIRIDAIDCLITRSGYTGEDGFEISVPAEQAETLARKLLAQPEVAPCGLGARDSLRLEAGLCLYGHDINNATSPIEAGLNWSIGKARRRGGEREGGFPGADLILRQIEQGVSRKRVGLRPLERTPVREGAELRNDDDKPVGKVTSGGFSPTVGGPVAMGYIASSYAKPDTELRALVRGKPVPVRVSKLPFVPQRYYRG